MPSSKLTQLPVLLQLAYAAAQRELDIVAGAGSAAGHQLRMRLMQLSSLCAGKATHSKCTWWHSSHVGPLDS